MNTKPKSGEGDRASEASSRGEANAQAFVDGMAAIEKLRRIRAEYADRTLDTYELLRRVWHVLYD